MCTVYTPEKTKLNPQNGGFPFLRRDVHWCLSYIIVVLSGPYIDSERHQFQRIDISYIFGFPAIGLCRRFLWPADKGWLGWSNSLRKPAKIWANNMGNNYEGNISERKSINKSPDFPIKLYCKMSGDLHRMITLHHFMVDFLFPKSNFHVGG